MRRRGRLDREGLTVPRIIEGEIVTDEELAEYEAERQREYEEYLQSPEYAAERLAWAEQDEWEVQGAIT